MSEPRLSGATRELLRGAKNDAPGAGARAKMWANLGGVAGTAAGSAAAGAASTGAAGGSIAPGAAAAGTAAASKMLALGTLLGGTITVGLAAALLRIGPAPSDVPVLPTAPLAAETAATFASPPPTSTTAAGATGATAAAPANAPLAPQSAPSPAGVPAGVPVNAPVNARVAAPPAVPTAVHAASPLAVTTAFRSGTSVDDTLSREAALVAEARGAIVRGDPQAALRSIHGARQLSSHQLLPEELAVEAQAYRALGREDEAREADSTLKKQFPESALAR